jgi:hypothetical protein
MYSTRAHASSCENDSELRLPQRTRYVLNSSATVSFSRTLLHGVQNILASDGLQSEQENRERQGHIGGRPNIRCVCSYYT